MPRRWEIVIVDGWEGEMVGLEEIFGHTFKTWSIPSPTAGSYLFLGTIGTQTPENDGACGGGKGRCVGLAQAVGHTLGLIRKFQSN